MSDKYILCGCGNARCWISRSQKRETVAKGVDVSTVFLGLNHSFGSGPPLLWETMIFGGPHDAYQERYATYDEAMAGHAKAVELAGGNQAATQSSSGHRGSAAP